MDDTSIHFVHLLPMLLGRGISIIRIDLHIVIEPPLPPKEHNLGADNHLVLDKR
jgi:hypothetical protein